MKVSVKTTVEIEKNIVDVWDIMGIQFGHVHLWSSNFLESKPGGISKFPGLDYSNRITLTERGETIQELDAFDSENNSLSYHITTGLPEAAKNATSVWSLNEIDQNKTVATFKFHMETQDFVTAEMIPKIEMGLTQSSVEIGKELKAYVESGKSIAQN
ncbi:MAG: hypothetical protein ACJAUD_000394 [Crocinitomicaceae bacterium]|jgi:hypothetical protein